jgi:hypothetical protein
MVCPASFLSLMLQALTNTNLLQQDLQRQPNRAGMLTRQTLAGAAADPCLLAKCLLAYGCINMQHHHLGPTSAVHARK